MKITKDMTIGELVRDFPEAIKVLFDFGMGCVGCPSAQVETIEEACGVHGLNMDELLSALNASVE
ncbi:hypothetical protein EAL2_808p00720 (plasmid) [Peptoclostridium acidaminophilum DSM 3953]|uniref:DUF1858 domain-containing protein n=1 Tax=Peptoclostridium acidaminophilum DSM 3953 TaxID=1286171 RepID=W8T766_PEPAC|nr:DUF1858 domain-containing protein [Peptoclostridium acidaminophilum]AHM57579.1 hypothetical protein EAL2_808p00720 [Peptoclostridium acidaminophilum DSM 3953]